MNKHIFAAFCLLAFASAGCHSGASHTARTTDATLVAGASAAAGARFTPPALPQSLDSASQEQKADYMVQHYWESFDFADSVQVFMPEVGEQIFADYLAILPYARPVQAEKSLHDMLRRAMAAGQSVFGHFTLLCEKYLCEPNSPYRNEELYIPVLRYIIAAPGVEDIQKLRPRHQLAMALKNRPGTTAAEFDYTTPEGRTRTLAALRGQYTLVLFYDPDCDDCVQVKKYIATSPVFTTMINDKRLALLALYPDRDLELWRANLHSIPSVWAVGCDPKQTINEKELYDLRATPTLYLLDADKRVLLKDASVDRIEAYLAEQNAAQNNHKNLQKNELHGFIQQGEPVRCR